MGSDLEFNPIEARHGFGDKSRDAEPGHAHAPRELPWHALMEALEDGDIPLARKLYRRLLNKHPDWNHPPFTEVGTLLASANHQAALEVLKTMRSLASAIQPRKATAAAAPQQFIGLRGQADLTYILGLKIDKSA
jgi:hypothetical protein